eukprot:CAMPEP_0114425476 /NCGR_PEP_ID=MMETSP0103-20121206/7255_1 /TAXON_ID=37642 ORGANISM="Paraphysomonas imperforata, Strain PA2" /NCGR_SAMPLE_ID=MMETSP0103 /ASSEMBLY_ACC=CAM_ASM_000201 /LENGTH=104 /DNA_ID=CAMNT_0001594313 /DNA_START=27 /DNA_END=341 /DNA_ORIENTATION=+
MTVKNIENLEEFKAAIAAESLVVVDFTASWCGPCQMIKPKFHAMAEANTDVVFLQVDVDACGDVAEECEVNCMPTFHFYKAGVKLELFEGADENKLKELVAKHK